MKGNLTRRGQRSWRLKFDAGSDPAGRRITKFVTVRGTKRQAQAEAAKIIAGIATGQHIDASRETVANSPSAGYGTGPTTTSATRHGPGTRSSCATISLPASASAASETTRRRSAGRLRRHGAGGPCRSHPAPPASGDAHHAQACRPMGRRRPQCRQHGRRSAGAVARGRDPNARPRSRRCSIRCAASRSIRSWRRARHWAAPRELLALRWQDVDLDGGHLRVERALEQTKRGGLLFKAPKTKYGRRLVTLPASTVTLLREHRKAQLELRMALGLGKEPDDALVFPNWDGSTRSPNGVTKEWALAMRKAGLKATLHSLRHTHASTLIASGLDVLTISRRLGHGSPAITLGIYGHLFKTDDRAAAIMEAALRGHRMRTDGCVLGANWVPILGFGGRGAC